MFDLMLFHSVVGEDEIRVDMTACRLIEAK
jgi:hypothetical protein